MPRGSDVYKSPWLKAEDLQDDEETFTITGSDLHEFDDRDGKTKTQIVLMFRETEKKFGLNVTNFGVLKDIFKSDETEDWHGRRIVLFVTQTPMSDGRQVDCLRVKRKTTEKLLAEDLNKQAKRQPGREGPRLAQPQRQTAPPVTQAEADGDDGDIPF